MNTRSDNGHRSLMEPDPPVFFLMHGVMLTFYLLELLNGPDSHMVPWVDKFLDWGALSCILLAGLAGLVHPRYFRPALVLSLLSISLSILLSMTSDQEVSLMLDLLILLSVSILMIIFIAPLVGVSHGVISAVLFGLQVFRYSPRLPYISSQITFLLGIFAAVVLVVSHFAQKLVDYEQDQQRVRIKLTNLEESIPVHSHARKAGELSFRLVHPVLVKSSNSLGIMENLKTVLQELREGEGLMQAQHELIRRLGEDMYRELHQLHRVLQSIADLQQVSRAPHPREPLDLRQIFSASLEQLRSRYGLLHEGIYVGSDSIKSIMGNRQLWTHIFTTLLEYSFYTGDIGDPQAPDPRLQVSDEGPMLLLSYSDPTAPSQGFDPLLEGRVRTGVSLERGTSLLFLEFLVEQVMEGSLKYDTSAPGFRVLIRFPKT